MASPFKPPNALAPLLTLALLSACGSPPTPSGSSVGALGSSGTSGLPKDFKYLHRLTIPAGMTESDLLTQYGGALLAFHPDQGSAILANNSASKGRYDGEDVEANARSYRVGELGFGTWSSGFSTWASGYSTWASGASTTKTPATTFAENVPLWNVINLGAAQALAPELGAGVTVAVIDTGLDLSHPAFKTRLDDRNWKDFVDGDTTPMEVNTSTVRNGHSTGYGHGTAVAGIILQVAPNATILPIRVLDGSGQGDTATLTAAVDYAISRGAQVINLSLGSADYSDTLDAKIRDANALGIAVICASGNSGDTKILYPAATAGSAAPSGHGSLSVGSVSAGLRKSQFSTYGAALELTAPGEGIVTAFPGAQTARVTGTSFATPVVSGLLALALSTGVNSGSGGQLSSMLAALVKGATPATDPVYASGLGSGTVNAAAFLKNYR